MAQEIESHLAENTLVMVNHQTVPCKYLEYLLKMGSILLLVMRCNHQLLKCLYSIGETKWHPQEFEQAKGGDDRCLGDILRCHWKLVITILKVNLGEDSASIQVGFKILDMRDRVAVIGCRGV